MWRLHGLITDMSEFFTMCKSRMCVPSPKPIWRRRTIGDSNLEKIFPDGRFKVEPVFFDFGMQGRPGKAEEFCRYGAVAAGKVKCFTDNNTCKSIDT